MHARADACSDELTAHAELTSRLRRTQTRLVRVQIRLSADGKTFGSTIASGTWADSAVAQTRTFARATAKAV
jgi:hypothetical protein